MTQQDWSKPRAVHNLEVAFPAHALELMPALEECEAWLTELDTAQRRKWVAFQRRWFYFGLPASVQVDLRTVDDEVIDGKAAWRHLKVIQASFEPKHEHKEAAVAYLASRWFTDVDYGDDDDHPGDGSQPAA